MNVLPPGSLVQITNDGPFRGLKGTIRTVDTIPSVGHEDPFCFYLVGVEGAWMQEPVWFSCDEVEEIEVSSVAHSQQNSRVPTR